MDLSGHEGFVRAHPPMSAEPAATGRALLALAWAALSSARAERVDIGLSGGRTIEGAREVRIRGELAEARTTPGLFDHGFPVADVIHVRLVPRGGPQG